MPGGRVVTVDHVGREGELSEKHTFQFVFHDFSTLPHQRGDHKKSSVVSCHGHSWQLQLYPRGDSGSDKSTVYVSAFLACVSALSDDCEVGTRFALRVSAGSRRGREFACNTCFSKRVPANGWRDVCPRSAVLNPSGGFLVEGSLTIEVDIQVYKKNSPAWTPKKTLNTDMQHILQEAKKTGDVTFIVGDVEFPAHKHILQRRAPQLAALAENVSSGAAIPIEKFSASTFRSLLHFVYAEDVIVHADDVPGSEVFQKEAHNLLHVADYFGCKGLKLEAEAVLVKSGVTVDTAADLILLGDSKNCALLKEAAVDFFAANPRAVMASSGWDKVKESAPVLVELMEVGFNDKKRPAPGDDDSDGRDYNRMCVSDLRRKLELEDLDVDGSREMLIKRLKANDALMVSSM